MSLTDGTRSIAIEQQYAAYLALGWALTSLHDVDNEARCTCGNAECKSAGKHPRYANWQLPAQAIRSAATLRSLVRQAGRRNFGVVTGPASGVWVLDVDAAGMTEYERWCEEHGRGWAVTLTARTGSGGFHLYFALPDDGGPIPRNVSKRKRDEGKVPPGIDVRGEGGQAVLPPSVSAKGSYSWVNWGAPIAAAPAWLLALVREEATAPETPSGSPLPSLPSPARDQHGEASSRGRAYAASAVAQLVGELAGAPEGTRNDAAFRTACRLIELCNAPWSGLDVDATYGQWRMAGEMHPRGVAVPEAELIAVWTSAARHVGAGEAELPPTWTQGLVVPFTSPPWASPSPTGHERVQGGDGGEATGATGGAGATAVEGQVLTLDEWLSGPGAALVGQEMGRLAVREEARRRLAATTGGTLVERVAKMRDELLDRAGLLALPAPAWLVPDVLQRDTLARIVGQPGQGKSFVALELAAAVGGGGEFAGRDTRVKLPVGNLSRDGAGVLYVVGEAIAETAVRVRAWEAAHGREFTGVTFYPAPVQAGDRAAWDALVVLASELAGQEGGLGLIVLDTQARVTVGMNENDPTEMGLFVEACERLRAATGACVLLVHHTPVGSERGRGTGAVLGALHTEILCRKEGRVIELRLAKQKGAPDGDDGPADLRFELRSAYEGAAGDADGFAAPATQVGVALYWIGDERRGQRDAGRTRDGHKIMVTNEELLGYTARAAGIAAAVLASPAAEVTKAEFAKMLVEQDAKGSDATWKRTWAELLSRRIVAQIRGTQRYRYIAPERRQDLTEPRRGERDGGAGFYCE